MVTDGTYFIPKCSKHRLPNTPESRILILIEVQSGDHFGKDDILDMKINMGEINPCLEQSIL